MAEQRTVARAAIDHLPGAAGHAREKRRGAIFAGAAHQPHADHRREQGAEELPVRDRHRSAVPFRQNGQKIS